MDKVIKEPKGKRSDKMDEHCISLFLKYQDDACYACRLRGDCIRNNTETKD